MEQHEAVWSSMFDVDILMEETAENHGKAAKKSETI